MTLESNHAISLVLVSVGSRGGSIEMVSNSLNQSETSNALVIVCVTPSRFQLNRCEWFNFFSQLVCENE